MKKAALITLTLVLGWQPPASAVVVYDFEPIPEFTLTPFVHPGAITATFSSVDDPAFFVFDAGFSALTGHVLLDGDPLFHTLDIVLSSPVTSMALLFALNDPGATTSLLLTAFSGGIGGTVVGMTSAMGVVPPGFSFPEGSLFFAGGVFDAVSISSTAMDFALDDIMVTEVPEPTSLVLMLAGLAGVALVRRRVSR